jgi:hypothetical protein
MSNRWRRAEVVFRSSGAQRFVGVGQGDMILMGDMLASLTAWKDAKQVDHPGKREVGQISVKQAEYAIQHFKEQFGERLPDDPIPF